MCCALWSTPSMRLRRERRRSHGPVIRFDDMSGEEIGLAADRLRAATGVLD